MTGLRRAVTWPARRVGRTLHAGSRARSRRAVLLAAAAATVVVAAVVLAVRLDQADDAADSGIAGADAAAALVPTLLSYDYRTIGADTAHIAAACTPGYAAANRPVLEATVAPAVVGRRAVAATSVSAAALVSSAPGRAVVLVLFTQTTTVPDLPAPRVDNRGARVTVVRDAAGVWKVDGLDPV